MNESWKPVPITGYEDLYEVSNTGKIRSVPRVVHKSEHWHNIYGEVLRREFDTRYSGRELKPYKHQTKKGVKYHLHKREKCGPNGQSDIYVYVDDLVREAFPELFEKEKH